jgi:glycosyltransferase involved in cell wall biosynthesis
VLAYFFPPLGGGGVQRTLKHVKYLPEHGYEPVVVTTRGRWYPAQDEGLHADVPWGTQVLAAPELPLAPLRSLALNPLHRLRMPGALWLLGWPDPCAGWIPGALWVAWRTVRRERPAAIYSTSAPNSAHVVALVLKLLTRLPWVADFRDPWVLNPHGDPPPRLVARANAFVERLVVRHADRLVVADRSMRLLGVDDGDPRFEVIGNGVDADDVAAVTPPLEERIFRVVYAGTLYGEQNAGPVFAAVERLVRRGAVDPDDLQLRIVGNDWRSPKDRSWPVPVEQTGYVTHREALHEMRAASVLVHYVAPRNRAAGGKIYEYLATGRPVLCVARPDGEAAALVRAACAGPVAAPDNPAAIECAILGLYRRWQLAGLPDQPGSRTWVLDRYSRRTLTRALARVLEAAIGDA